MKNGERPKEEATRARQQQRNNDQHSNWKQEEPGKENIHGSQMTTQKADSYQGNSNC